MKSRIILQQQINERKTMAYQKFYHCSILAAGASSCKASLAVHNSDLDGLPNMPSVLQRQPWHR